MSYKGSEDPKNAEPNNPLRTTEAYKFPLEVLRVGPGDRGKVTQRGEGREAITKAFGGKPKGSGGTVTESRAMETPGVKTAGPSPSHCVQTACRTLGQTLARLRGCLHSGKEKCKSQEEGKCLFRRGLSLASEVSDHVLQQPPGL